MIDQTTIKQDLFKRTLLSYRGPFYIELISVFGSNIKEFTKEYDNTRRKLFRIFIELSQNVSYYSEHFHMVNNVQRIGLGEMDLKEYETFFTFTTKNRVKNSDAKILSERCKLVNQSDHLELRHLKREQRMNSPGEKFGARIGLIQAVMLSKNQLKYKIEKIDDKFSMFSITVKIDKI
ncbi:MAG: SiaB family protein kinase [Bacteroidota bacterium]|nr:SiaB family protein kinase [Bacteroidota bacterium]